MRKTIYNKYEKGLIAKLPRAVFEGRTIVILTPGETEKAVRYLLSQPVLGFDTETKPSFKRGQVHKVALLQVATEDTCFLFRLKHTGLTPALIRLLEDTTTTKVGLSWHDDVHSLHALGDFTPGSFIELQKLVNELGIEDMSLQKLYANLFGQKISKREQLSNWDADVLNDKQKAYAATDAWACVKIYKEVIRLKETHEYELIIQNEEETAP
ncbi:MAG: 3'-5' exonuclease domain-containing protein 2 [Prevotella sp.]|nr:3'-5' exonuclease domain-containing protein 2 [Prevotella sp.]